MEQDRQLPTIPAIRNELAQNRRMTFEDCERLVGPSEAFEGIAMMMAVDEVVADDNNRFAVVASERSGSITAIKPSAHDLFYPHGAGGPRTELVEQLGNDLRRNRARQIGWSAMTLASGVLVSSTFADVKGAIIGAGITVLGIPSARRYTHVTRPRLRRFRDGYESETESQVRRYRWQVGKGPKNLKF